MNRLFDDELSTKMLFCRIKKEIKEEQLERAINNLEYYNSLRKKVITKCDIALQANRKNNC